MVSLGFFWFWGIFFIIANTFIAVIKKESSEGSEVSNEHKENSIWKAYKLGIKILWIPSIRILMILLITVKAAWAFHDDVSFFKFLDSGISNEKMIPLNAISVVPARIIAPLIIAKYAAGPTPMKLYIGVIPYRTLFSLIGVLIVYLTPFTIPKNGVAPSYIYFVYLINDILYMFCLFSMYATMTAFFVKISDPSVGGTYMTMLNTIDHLGGIWPNSLALWLVEYMTWRNCASTKDLINSNSMVNGTHVSYDHIRIMLLCYEYYLLISNLHRLNSFLFSCQQFSPIELNKRCPIVIDGFYIETFICLILGLLWYKWGIPKIKYLEQEPLKSWRISKQIKEPSENRFIL